MKVLEFKELTQAVAAQEGKKREVDIAQISEITKIVLEELGKRFYGGDPRAVLMILHEYSGRT